MKTIVRDGTLMSSLMKGFERTGARYTLFGELYNRLFYAPMLCSELNIADLKEGTKIIHIGCGPLPLTALYLGREGFHVVGVDKDQEALKRAREMVEQNSLEDRIELRAGDGMDLDYSSYEAVWISLHARPQDMIIEKALETLPEGGKIICRNSRSYLKPLYSAMKTRGLTRCQFKRKRQLLGKETLLIEKLKKGRRSLKDLREGMEGEISILPDAPLLSSLGLRPGKPIKVRGREPFNGPVITEVEGRRIALGLNIAQQIQVESG